MVGKKTVQTPSETKKKCPEGQINVLGEEVLEGKKEGKPQQAQKPIRNANKEATRV